MLLRPSLPRTAGRAARRGFSLLEVLVVVAIIVMLAGLGGYYVVQQYEDAKVSTAKIQASTLSEKAETYKVNNGDYPPSLDALAQPQPNGGSPLVPPDKLRDPWGRPFQFDPAGARNGGLKADVFTTTPRGVTVGNFTAH